MEARVKKYHRQLSPERSKVWKEPSPKCHQIRKVPVVYYLCRNRQLEHPHVIDVPLSSTEGLYLRDVIDRLNVLRGKGMASMYSWSSKRSYKNGFVWNDLCEDDLILPSNGNEYVLKASEFFQEPSSGAQLAPTVNAKVQNPKQMMEPTSTRSNDDSSSSSSLNGRDTKHSQDDEFSPPVRRSASLCESPESTKDEKSSPWNAPLSLTEYKVYNSVGLADASTQTEETVGKHGAAQETCTRGVSTDEPECSNARQNEVEPKEPKDSISSTPPPPSSSSESSSNGKIDTLESLIQADVRTMNSFRILEEGDLSYRKVKASNMLMQLLSCGSLSVKDRSFGIIPNYRPRLSHTKFGSPLFSTSLMMGELDCLSENTRLMGLRLENKEYFSGSLVETSIMKRSSSYNADRSCNHPRSESMRSAVSSNGNSRRFTEEELVASHGSKQTKEVDSSLGKQQQQQQEDKMIKIEERLASGARVIIQSTTVPVENCEL